MELLTGVYTSIGSIVVLYILTKIMGNRQIGQLNMFDYIVSITIGSIASEMAVAENAKFGVPLIAMIIYAGICTLLNIVTNKSLSLRRVLTGRSIILLENNVLYIENLKKARMDINELLTQFRVNGYFDVADIYCAFLEPNGQVSILPREVAKNVTIKDMKLAPQQTKPAYVLVLDGKILFENLAEAKLTEKWLFNNLKSNGANDINNVVLASVDDKKTLTVFTKNKDKPKNDRFQ